MKPPAGVRGFNLKRNADETFPRDVVPESRRHVVLDARLFVHHFLKTAVREFYGTRVEPKDC